MAEAIQKGIDGRMIEDISKADRQGNTALLLAVCQDDRLLLQAILDQGADIDAQNHDGDTALTLAIRKGFAETACWLIRRGANVNLANFDSDTPLILAARGEESPAVLEMLLGSGAHVHAKNNVGDTALHVAAYFGNLDIARRLIQNQADVHAKNINGDSPLHKAAIYGWDSMTELLLSAGADKKARNSDGKKPDELKPPVRPSVFTMKDSQQIKEAAQRFRALREMLADQNEQGTRQG
jgi:uncharacterized protein